MKSYQELEVELKAQIEVDVTNLGIKAEGMVAGMNLLLAKYNEQVDAETKLDAEPIAAI